MTELLVGTEKGLFVLRGDAAEGRPFEIAHRPFPGEVVEYAILDRRTGRYVASVTSAFYGPRLMLAEDPAGEWRQASGPALPEGADAAVERIWVVEPSEGDGLLYAGTAPAALFASTDGGETWALNEPLWAERVAGEWRPGAGGLALHSICPWPGEPERLAVGISAAGVWLTEDGGRTWRPGFEGLVPEYLPEEAREGTNVLCVHDLRRAPLRPERLFMQFHGGVYRSDDAGERWRDIRAGLPSAFGFPLAIDPADPDSAFVVPLVGAEDRVTPDGRLRVFGTRDAGATWASLGTGLPEGEVYLTVLRQAFDVEGEGEGLGLYVGATNGEVFGSGDGGASWFTVRGRLPKITSVRVA